ncbi:hypothetical protein [Streptomyces sp. NPDC005930]
MDDPAPHWFARNFTELDFFAGLWSGAGELRLPTGTGREAFLDLEDRAA